MNKIERQKANARNWYLNNKERHAAKRKKWRSENREKNNEAERQYRLRNPDVHKRGEVRRKYGISLEQAKEIWSRECEICGSKYKIHIDHDHKTGLVRGALCFLCNTGVSHLDKPGWLEKALAYLNKSKERAA